MLKSQTAVLEEQLGAQVWPYVSVTEGVSNRTVRVRIANDVLGPAVLGSLTAFVDGTEESNYFGILRALLGPKQRRSKPKRRPLEHHDR